MSRGQGKLQRSIWGTILQHGKPMTFAEMRGGPHIGDSFERSARRALQKMVKDDVLIAIGTGGRGQPFRYFPHPFLIGMMDDKAKARELLQALDA